MVFKSFHFQIIIRVVLLTTSLLLFSYCIATGVYLRSVYAGVLSILQLVELIYFIFRFTRNINTLLQSIQERDFNLHFSETKSSGLYSDLHATLNKLTALFKKISREKEIKQRYLETLIEHISFGIISFDEQGTIMLVNQAFLKLSGSLHLTSFTQLQQKNKTLFDEIQALSPGKKKLIKLHGNNQIVTLSLYATEFKLDEQSYTLISAQNISNELSTTEIEAWQRLIKVLTHEIMNSISPILSLSGTLHEISKRKTQESSEWSTLNSGLEAIKIRSEGLLSFTQRYRELTQIPSPKFQNVDADGFIEHVMQLVSPELNARGIVLKVNSQPVKVTIDSSLMEQVLINIIHNAIDALDNIQNPSISIQLTSKGERTHFVITDNGSGIDAANLDKIFVPFFTTKKNGSGIGLALSRQIVLLHGGEIFVHSEIKSGTVFTIVI